jgi:hypothetical protein
MKRFLALLMVLGAAGAAITAYTRVSARKADSYGDEDSDTFDLVIGFEGREFESHARSFAGGSILVTCGGAEIDLRAAQIDPMGAYLEVDCWFGGVELTVPDTWRVVLNSQVHLGGAENSAARLLDTLPDDAPTLEIDARVVLGGLDIRAVAPTEATATEAAPA